LKKNIFDLFRKFGKNAKQKDIFLTPSRGGDAATRQSVLWSTWTRCTARCKGFLLKWLSVYDNYLIRITIVQLKLLFSCVHSTFRGINCVYDMHENDCSMCETIINCTLPYPLIAVKLCFQCTHRTLRTWTLTIFSITISMHQLQN
jgi:hypothetical protein